MTPSVFQAELLVDNRTTHGEGPVWDEVNQVLYWVAQWGGGCICHWCPESGGLLQRIETGCPQTSSCCFGNEGALYITTSRLGLSPADLTLAPHSGSLFLHIQKPNL